MIGLFGGAFDPVHFGHLRPALEAFETLALEELRFIPLNRAPHKHQPVLSGEIRYRLLRSALAGQPGFVADRCELDRGGVSWTVDTLTQMRQRFGESRPLALLLGSDAFAGLPTWRNWLKILEKAHIVVMQRPGGEIDQSAFPEGYIQSRIVAEPQRLREQSSGLIVQMEVTQLAISSTRIRQLLDQGRSVRYLVPEPEADALQRQWVNPLDPEVQGQR